MSIDNTPPSTKKGRRRETSYIPPILEARDSDTVITCRRLVPTRSLNTEFSRSLLKLEESGASADEIREYLGYSRARTGQIEGDLIKGEAYCGAAAGMINEIIPAASVIQRLVDGYQEVRERLSCKT